MEPLPDADAAAKKDFSAADAVWPVPLERTVSYGSGTSRAPAAIIRAGRELERWDDELALPVDWDVRLLDAVEDVGLQSIGKVLGKIREAAQNHYRKHSFVVALGGEHTLTIPLVRAAKAVFGPLGVLHIDAHADLRSRYLGRSLSHACVLHHVRRISARTVSVGIRSLSRQEAERIDNERIRVFRAHEIANTSDAGWIERVVSALPPVVYLTVDVDGFDPSVFPGAGTPEPGGLSWHQGLALLRHVFTRRRVVAADIVEAVPLPGAVTTEYTAARLALKMMVYRRYGSYT